MNTVLGLALWLAAAGHFGLLVVSVNVPRVLSWRTELAALAPINRKLMWIFGGYVVFTYLAFGVLTVVLHDEFLSGSRAAIALAVFIGLYWLVRLVLDSWMGSSHWPAGWFFRLCHIMLNLLFGFLAATYLAVALWQLL